MSDKPRRSGLQPESSFVRDQLDRAQRQAEEGKRRGAGKPGHAGTVGRDRAGRERATYNVSLARQSLIREIAQAEDISLSNVVEFAIVVLHSAWQRGDIDLGEMKRPTRSLRVTWELEIPDKFSFFSSQSQP